MPLAPKGEAPAEPPADADAAPKSDELRDAPSNGEGALVEALAASWPPHSEIETTDTVSSNSSLPVPGMVLQHQKSQTGKW